MKTRIVPALALILVLLTVSSTSVAAKVATVPFRVALQTFPVETGFDPVTGILSWDIPGEDRATHLGRSTFESVSYVYLYSPYPYRQVSDAALIAANGDRLNLAFEGTVVPGAFEGEWWIDENGTGRFDGVTGSGVYWGGFDGEEWHLYMEGTLTKP